MRRVSKPAVRGSICRVILLNVETRRSESAPCSGVRARTAGCAGSVLVVGGTSELTKLCGTRGRAATRFRGRAEAG